MIYFNCTTTAAIITLSPVANTSNLLLMVLGVTVSKKQHTICNILWQMLIAFGSGNYARIHSLYMHFTMRIKHTVFFFFYRTRHIYMLFRFIFVCFM